MSTTKTPVKITETVDQTATLDEKEEKKEEKKLDRKITLVLKNGYKVTVPYGLAKVSNLVSAALEAHPDDTEVALNEVPDKETLDLFVDYMTYRKGSEGKMPPRPLPTTNLKVLADKGEIDAADLDFLNKQFFDQPLSKFFKVITAALYMDMPVLFELLSVYCAAYIKGKTPEEVKAMTEPDVKMNREKAPKVKQETTEEKKERT